MSRDKMTQEIFFDLGIGTRLKRVYELLSTDMEKVYQEAGLDFRVRHFPVVFALHNLKELSIAELQNMSALTQSAISQTVKQLIDMDIVALKVGEDARSRIVHLTKEGEVLVERLLPLWRLAKKAIQDIRAESDHDLMAALEDFEECLRQKGLYQRIEESKKHKIIPDVDIVPFHVKYRQDWYDINKQWIETYFELEEPDLVNLNQPEKNILAEGGEIYFALSEGQVLGVVALKHHGDNIFEVSKMGVRPEARGLGVGQKLMDTVVDRFYARGGGKLFLETNHQLAPAIALYEKSGFVHAPSRPDTPYVRADVYMEYRAAK
tara:strand:- start:1718 stop:2680 length:963 start_codon:yes stop_codon:yes gene_type:complete